MPERSHGKPAIAVFLVASALLWFFVADRLRLNVDEGMYLHGALRSYNGETVFRDFAGQTGPGTFWLCETAFRLFGVSLLHARIPLILGLAAMAAGVFYLTAALTERAFAFGVACVFLLLEASNTYLLAVNHRWDSGAFAFMAVILTFCAIRRHSHVLSFGAGMCAAAAAWVTPNVGLIAVPLGAWLLFHRDLRRFLASLLAGGALVTATSAGFLAAKGALAPMIHDLLETASSYSAANRMPYGYSGTGITEAAAGLGLVAKVLFSVVLVWVFIPAILPPLAYLGWTVSFAFHRDKKIMQQSTVVFLLMCSLALLASTYPRWDMGHLLYATPVFYVLVGALIYTTLPRRLLTPIGAGLALLLGLLWRQPLLDARDFTPMRTPSGPVAVRPDDRAFIESLQRYVRPGDGLFVFPNFPTVYFLTGGANPSRFLNLLAGFMTDEHEQAAIRELKARPPRWVVYWDVSPERYLKTLPSADPKRLRFNAMEEYLRTNYHVVETRDHWHGPYSVLERVERQAVR